jgi:hypothetical protein
MTLRQSLDETLQSGSQVDNFDRNFSCLEFGSETNLSMRSQVKPRYLKVHENGMHFPGFLDQGHPRSLVMHNSAKDSGGACTAEATAMVHMDLLLPDHTDVQVIFWCYWHVLMSCINTEDGDFSSRRGVEDMKEAVCK